MQRSNYFEGMEVSVHDMTHSQLALTGGITGRTSDTVNPGVVNGLSLYPDAGGNHIAASAGSAYDSSGERIYVPVAVTRIGYSNVNLNAAAGTYNIAAQYVLGNDGTSGVTPDGVSQLRHYLDSYSISALKSGVDATPSAAVLLGNVIVTVNGGSLIVSTSNRASASAKLTAVATAGPHATTHLQSGTDPIQWPVTVHTGSGGVTLTTSNYFVIVNKSVGDTTVVTLPASPTLGTLFYVKDGKGDSNTNPITVTPASGTIDGATNFLLQTNYGSINAVYNGTQYNIW